MSVAPSAKHILIGHSHGGNVALYALREPLVANAVKRLVLLGTPFLTVRPRTFDAAAAFAAMTLGLFGVLPAILLPIVVGVAFALCAFLLVPNISLVILLILFAIGGSVGHFLLSTIAAMLQAIGVKLNAWILKKRGDILGKYGMPKVDCPCLVAYVAYDEPYSWLRMLELISSIPFRLGNFLVSYVVAIPPIGFLLLLSYCSIDTVVGEKNSFVSLWSLGAAILEVVIFYPAAYVVILLILILPPLVRGNPAAFGWEGFITAALVSISVSSLPSRELVPRARTLKFPVDRNVLFGRRHSYLHDDPRVINAVIEWIRNSQPDDRTDTVSSETTSYPKALRYALPILAACLAYVFVLSWDYHRQQGVLIDSDLPADNIKPAQDHLILQTPWLSLGPHQYRKHTFDVPKEIKLEGCYLAGRYRSDSTLFEMMIVEQLDYSKDEFAKALKTGGYPKYEMFTEGDDDADPKTQPSTEQWGVSQENTKDPIKIDPELVEEQARRLLPTPVIYESVHSRRKQVEFARWIPSQTQPINHFEAAVRNAGSETILTYSLEVAMGCPSKAPLTR